MEKCSVIIVNYNTGELLKAVVDAVEENTDVENILVIDNCSRDNSMAALRESKKLRKYYRKHNYGFAKGCNYGRAQTQSDYLLFLNPDCLIGKNVISTLMEALQNSKETAIIGCRVNNPDGSEQRASRRRLPTFWRALKTFSGIEKLAKYCHCFEGVNLIHRRMPTSKQTVEAISGAFILMRTKVFDEINGFDEVFPMHFEDLDLFKRTRDKDYTIIFDPNTSVVHYQGTSSLSNPKVAVMKKQGLQRYFRKHCSKFSYFIVKLLG